ncbi:MULTISPECIES: hypothetical protein [Bacillus cereus group]|nr:MULTISPECIES: hypothetical protein [Bacillus cereus group]MDO6628734.1 hypothetical protein [Bacillus thuringiensis]MDO6659344.1 hypothetical protein [Bacillus thuringiensis]MDO6698927.1 hypothetical protein [Bacillus thuringiensis]MEB9469433.1 hypothetical protein [Bacillus cereus]MEC0031021.1 hypothetical protein [Bacillus cereus]
MTVTYVQEPVGDYIGLYSGRRFYPMNPRPEDVTVLDIAHSLSRMPRYAGHLEKFYTVGEHSLYCYWIAKKLGFSPLIQMYCLMHDASESIVCDLPRPLKDQVPEYKKIEDGIMSTIWDMVGIPHPTKEDYHIVKKIDNTILIFELIQLAQRFDIPDVEHFSPWLLSIDLEDEVSMTEIKMDFLSTYEKLLEEIRKEG